MKIGVSEWQFNCEDRGTLVYDLYLDNGQHALLEVNPMKCGHVANGMIPELIVFCELSGERLGNVNAPARWISRPPRPECPWSRVELPPGLHQHLQERLAGPAVPAARAG